MSIFKKILQELNLPDQCAKYKVPLWQCPQFLFVVMGFAIGIFSIVSYSMSTYYNIDPQIVALVILLMSMVLLVISYVVIKSLEKMAESSRLKTEFIGIVSHQLRTPITNMSWGMEMLSLTGGFSEKQKEYLDIVTQNLSRMNRLLQDLLVISKLEQGRLVARPESIKPVEFIKDAVLKLQPIANLSNVRLEFSSQNIDPNLEIVVDPSQLKIIIENIVGNAIRYSKKGGRVQVSVKREDKNIVVSIKDEGIGIPQEDQKFIGKRFFRASNARTYQPQGTGLGLSICKAFLDLVGGKLNFISEENKGSTFWFTLPIK